MRKVSESTVGRLSLYLRLLTELKGEGVLTLLPARRLEGWVPQMRDKGRLRVGADADITVFDAATVIDRATYEKPDQPSAGIVHVLVNGTRVVRAGELVPGALPGQAIRR